MTAQLQGPANYDLDLGLSHSPQKQCHQNRVCFSTKLPHKGQLQVYTSGIKLKVELTTKKTLFLAGLREKPKVSYFHFYFQQPSRKKNNFNFWLVNHCQLLSPFILPLSHYSEYHNEMFVYQSTFHYQSNRNYKSSLIGI